MAVRNEREIMAEYDELDPEAVANGKTNAPGMTYEQGVEAALRWAAGLSDDKPLTEE